jgi:hypothetical protein
MNIVSQVYQLRHCIEYFLVARRVVEKKAIQRKVVEKKVQRKVGEKKVIQRKVVEKKAIQIVQRLAKVAENSEANECVAEGVANRSAKGPAEGVESTAKDATNLAEASLIQIDYK